MRKFRHLTFLKLRTPSMCRISRRFAKKTRKKSQRKRLDGMQNFEGTIMISDFFFWRIGVTSISPHYWINSPSLFSSVKKSLLPVYKSPPVYLSKRKSPLWGKMDIRVNLPIFMRRVNWLARWRIWIWGNRLGAIHFKSRWKMI